MAINIRGVALMMRVNCAMALSRDTSTGNASAGKDRPSDMLVRNSMLGASLAVTLGAHPAALMRGHGSVVVGAKIQIAVGRTTFHLNHTAKMQCRAMMAMGGSDAQVVYMDDAEVAANVVWQEYVRSSDLWKKKWRARLAVERAQR